MYVCCIYMYIRDKFNIENIRYFSVLCNEKSTKNVTYIYDESQHLRHSASRNKSN